MPSKPNKFGIKFWLDADVDSKYVLNVFPYLVKDEDVLKTYTSLNNVVLHLIKPFQNKGRIITTDNFFTTLNLSQMLKMKNTSLTGTMKRNWKEVPEFVKKVKMPLYDTLLLEHDDITSDSLSGKNQQKCLIIDLPSSHS
ncbi:uncharacterized protein LOC118191260 [Stegodyphus dumicola]|uniref:uncharacterized protein LOC118191260 n=1 Tax=Stegodyphus dumicola TaxID=202533 RepID=UPI0015B2577F|nr:uncharacterized protein LOC118191260 [Stegodyphus dumicola]